MTPLELTDYDSSNKYVLSLFMITRASGVEWFNEDTGVGILHPGSDLDLTSGIHLERIRYESEVVVFNSAATSTGDFTEFIGSMGIGQECRIDIQTSAGLLTLNREDSESGVASRVWLWSTSGSETTFIEAINENDRVIFSFWIPPEVPGRVTPSPSLTVLDYQSIQVAWNTPSDGGSSITGYIVAYREEGEVDYAEESATGSPYTLNGLSSETVYTIRVRAQNSVGPGDWSSTATETTTSIPMAPEQPLAPRVYRISTTSAEVAWSEPDDNDSPITGYELRYRVGMGAYTIFAFGAISLLSTAVINLDNTAVYAFQVRAQNSAGYSLWSPETEFTTGNNPPVIAPASMPDATINSGSFCRIQSCWLQMIMMT